MRYLGTVASVVAGQELHHIKTLLEREVVVRSVKHLVNHELRESSDTHLSATLAHLFNLLLAPFPLLEKLETGSIGYPITPIESLKQTEVPNAVEEEAESKTEKKKQKKQKKKAIEE